MCACRLLFIILALSVFRPEEGFAVSHSPEYDSTEVSFRLDSLSFQELIVSGKKNPVEMKGDTLVFDVSSFFVPEGAKLRLLLERIPGIEVTGDGRILAHGKEVVRIKLNGRTFLEEGKELALNNLPVDILCEVRLYKEHSDEEGRTGLHRESGDQVLDVYTHADSSNGWLADASLAGGSKERYQAGMTVNGFSEATQGLLSCSSDNQPAVYGVGESFLDKLSVEANVSEMRSQSYNGIINLFRGAWEINGTAFLNKGKTLSASDSRTEYYWKEPNVRTLASDNRETDTGSANFSLDWAYAGNTLFWETKTYLNHSLYDYSLYSFSETWETYMDLLEGELVLRDRALNSSHYQTMGELENLGAGFSTQLNKSWGEKGSNWDLSAGMQYTRNDEDGLSHSEIYYSLPAEMSRPAQESQTKKNGMRSYLKGILTLALLPKTKMQLAYGLEHQNDEVRRQVYDRSYVFLDMLPDGNFELSDSLDKQARLISWVHDVRALVQYDAGAWQLTGGVTLQPQRMNLHYIKAGEVTDSTQTVFSVLPELTFAYQKADRWNLDFRYLGRRKQPDLSALLPIWDCTDPLRRYVGNVSLKPEINHIFSCSFFSFEPSVQRQLNMAANAAVNQNTITQKTGYDAGKGSYTVTPVNVDGNWSASIALDFTTSFRNARRWNVEWKSTLSGSSERAVQALWGYEDYPEGDLWLRVRSLTTTHYGALQYKYRSFLCKPYGYMTLARYKNDQQQDLNTNLWVYGYGGLMRLDFDFGLSFGMDFYRNCRTGYWGEGMNGQEWICNLEVVYSFLKNRALEVKLQGFDVLQERRLVNQASSVTFRQETVNHRGVNSYFMLTLNYHFDRFPMRG